MTANNVYCKPNGARQCIACRDERAARFKAKREALEASEPVSTETPPPRKKAPLSVDERAAGFANLALEELVHILTKSKSEARRHHAGIAILAQAKTATASNNSITPEAIAEIARRQEEWDRMSRDPIYFAEVIVRAVESGQCRFPANWVPPSAPTAQLVESEPTALLNAPEPEPAKIEDAVVVVETRCICNHDLSQHPSGSNCVRCSCPLWVAYSDAMEFRSRRDQTDHN